MAKAKHGRKLIWLTAGVMLFAVPMAPPGTFNPSTYLDQDPEPQDGVAPAPEPQHAITDILDPAAEPAPKTADVEVNPEVIATPRKDASDHIAIQDPGVSGIPGDVVATDADRSHAPLQENGEQSGEQSYAENQTPSSIDDNAVDPLVDPAPASDLDESATVPHALEGEEAEIGNHEMTAEEVATPAPEEPREWSRKMVSGDTLDALLSEADIPANQRYAITTAIADKYNIGRLRPGNEVRVTRDLEDEVSNVTIVIDKNNSIEAVVGESVEVTVVKPDTSRHTVASKVTINGSIFSSLSKQGVPTQFASSISNALSGHVNFRRDLQAGDTLEMLWSQKRTDDGDAIGGSDISYARLNARGRTFDVVWEKGSASVFRDGDVIRTFSSPVPGARISSKYGMRTHPVLGGRRMHDGADFAATTGTPILASTAGTVSYVGWRGGYGRVVEIQHSPSVKTRYAHLSRYGAKKGQRVEAGQRIGYVGSSGRVTGPHLHYEFLLNGRAVDPMASGRWKSLEASSNEREKLNKLAAARKSYEKAKASEIAPEGKKKDPQDNA